MNTKMTRVQNMIVHKRRKEKLTLRIDPIEMDKVRRKAKDEGVSLSKAGGAYFKTGLEAERGEASRKDL